MVHVLTKVVVTATEKIACCNVVVVLIAEVRGAGSDSIGKGV